MLFVCSKEGIVLFSYGAKVDTEGLTNISRLVVTIGCMSTK